MKKILLTLLATSLGLAISAQNLKPYVLASSTSGIIREVSPKVKSSLEGQGFKIVGEYRPYQDPNRWLIVVSHPMLDKSVQAVGGLTGFAATLRVAMTTEDGSILISYTNPAYWGHAYFRDDYPKVEANYKAIEKAFTVALNGFGTTKNEPFGSEKGIEPEDLHKYHYMFGMPYFDETRELASFDSYEGAVAKIDESLKTGKPDVKLVYGYEVPGTKLKLYGIALSGSKGEGNFMPKIDINSPKHTAFLPYEILVKGNEVHMLHGRFRIALSFPDLTMGTFTKIMSTPGDIEDLMKQLVE